MVCPRCGTVTDSWPCPNCGFPETLKRQSGARTPERRIIMKKKVLMVLMAVVFAFAFTLAGCGGSESEPEEETTAAETEATTEAEATEAAGEELTGTQTIQMGNVEMDIPAAWVYDEAAGAEMTHVYKKADGSVEFQIEAMQASSEVDEAVLGEMTQKYAEQLGFGDVGYYDTTIAGSISGKIIPVDKEIHPQGKNQRIYTLGKGKTVVAISFLMDGDDFTEMNEALDTVHFMF